MAHLKFFKFIFHTTPNRMVYADENVDRSDPNTVRSKTGHKIRLRGVKYHN